MQSPDFERFRQAELETRRVHIIPLEVQEHFLRRGASMVRSYTEADRSLKLLNFTPAGNGLTRILRGILGLYYGTRKSLVVRGLRREVVNPPTKEVLTYGRIAAFDSLRLLAKLDPKIKLPQDVVTFISSSREPNPVEPFYMRVPAVFLNSRYTD